MSGEQEFESNGGDVEQEARSLGWVPQEEFRGNADHWVSAEEFVERGRAVMPILKKNNQRLQAQVLTSTQKIGTLEAQLAETRKAMERLEAHYTDANKRAVETAKVQLRAELKNAVEDRDVDRELEIRDQLDDLKVREKALTEEPVKPVPKTPEPGSADDKISPEFREWNKENPWFNKDAKKTKLISRIAEDLRDEGTDLKGREFLDECLNLYIEQYGDPNEEEAPEKVTPAPRKKDKVEGSSNQRRSSQTRSSFASLPAEAKAACHNDAELFVGPGKRYATLKEWEAKYTEIYNSEG